MKLWITPLAINAVAVRAQYHYIRSGHQCKAWSIREGRVSDVANPEWMILLFEELCSKKY